MLMERGVIERSDSDPKSPPVLMVWFLKDLLLLAFKQQCSDEEECVSGFR